MNPFQEPNLKTQWLEQFIVLAQTGNLQAAADRLGVSRQTLQRSLNQLENCAQAQLLSKRKQGLQLTPTGQLFLTQATEILGSLNQLKSCFQDKSIQNLVGTIAFAWQSASCFDFIPKSLNEFLREHPDVFLTIQCEPQTDILKDRLSRGQLDLAVMDIPLSEPEFVSFVIRRSPFVIVSAPQASRHWQDLKYALPRANSAKASPFKRWDEEKYPREVIFTADSLDALLDWCISGRAAAFLPQIAVQSWLDRGQLAIVAEAPEQIHKEILVCSTSESLMKPAVKAFWASLKKSGKS